MTPIASRFLLPALALLLLAGVPVWMHARGDRHYDDCLNPALLSQTHRIPNSWGARVLENLHKKGVVQWIVGSVEQERSGVGPLRFQIIRSFEPLTLYRHAMGGIDGLPFADEPTVHWVEAGDQRLPVTVLRDAFDDDARISAYLFGFDNLPVLRPFGAILESTPRQLQSGTLPLTMIRVYGPALRPRVEVAEELALQWIADAWRFYDSACAPRRLPELSSVAGRTTPPARDSHHQIMFR